MSARAIKSVRPTLLIKRDGNEMYIESTASPIRDGSGAVSGGVLVFHDVSESRELNRKLSYHASHDILTGLVNRREFEARLGTLPQVSGGGEPALSRRVNALFQEAESQAKHLKDDFISVEHLVLAARARGESAMGIQIFTNDAEKRYGFTLNPVGTARTASFVPKPKDRLVVLAEDDG